jgi:putative ubiquitin-RnfH superfamily antitoxin RatB of RatAB toxin-antitoxin module
MATPDSNSLSIEVAHAASPEEAIVIPLRVRPGTTVAEAIRLSGILRRCPGIDLNVNRVGIFGRSVAAQAHVEDGDRIEIYRPLRADPKESRRHRALQQKGRDTS